MPGVLDEYVYVINSMAKAVNHVVHIIFTKHVLVYLGHPCQPLTVTNSDTQTKTGVYETAHIVMCDFGHVTPDIKSTFVVVCQHNGIWNMTTCDSKYLRLCM